MTKKQEQEKRIAIPKKTWERLIEASKETDQAKFIFQEKEKNFNALVQTASELLGIEEGKQYKIDPQKGEFVVSD